MFSSLVKESDNSVSVHSEVISKDDFDKLHIYLTKLYFEDFDNNNLLDIIVWKRAYHPRSRKYYEDYDSAGWHFTDERFSRFEESPNGFKEVSVTTEQAKKMLNEHGLTWRKGFPDQRACKDGTTEPFTFFTDPVLHE